MIRPDADIGGGGPFEHYAVSGSSIRAAAEATRGRVPAIASIREQVDGYAKVTLSAVEGTLVSSVANAPEQATAQADDVTQKATYAAGAVEMFAGYVDDFDYDSADPRSVSKLNAAYAAAAASDFGTPAADYPPHATAAEIRTADDDRAADVSQARSALLSTLRAEYGRLENRLDSHAKHVAGMLQRGPNSKDLHEMYAAGALPSYASLIFPGTSFTGVTITELPYDLRSLSPSELARWLIENKDAPQELVDFALRDSSVASEVGKQLADAVDRDRGMAPAWVWDALGRFNLNTDVAAAFVSTLGSHNVARLLAGREFSLDGDDVTGEGEDTAQSRLVTLGYLMAGASRAGVLTRDFLESFDAMYTDVGMNMHAMASLMAYGRWDKDALKTIGDVALHGDVTDLGLGLVFEGRAQILKGISYNPIAAAEFFHENLDEINRMTDGDGYYNFQDSTEQDLADFIHSATIDADREYFMAQLDDPTVVNLAQANTVDLMTWLKDNPDVHMSDETQRVYGDIAVHYMDDLKAAVTSPVPEYFASDDPGRDGIEATDDLWAGLMQEAMRDPDTAAGLSIEFKNEVLTDLDASQRQNGPENSNGLTNAQVGQLENWFVDNFNETKNEVQGEVDDWNDRVDAGISKGLDYVVATGESLASGNPAPLLVQAGKDAAEGLLGGLVHREAPTYDVDTDWANNFSADWQQVAGNKLESGQIRPVTVDGITWEGDPKFYEDLYSGDFTNSDGSIKTYAEMTTADKRAYAEWLQDPAVQNAAYGDWSENQMGGVPRSTS